MADRISIFRNGNKIGDFKKEELDEKKLSFYMTGREVEYPRYNRKCKDNTPVLEISHLTRQNQYDDINLTVRPGDIIGLTGLLGSGRTELAMSLFGLNPTQSGIIKIDGKEVKISSPMIAKQYGIALLPEDRFTQGLFIEKKIKENITSAILDKILSNKMLDKKKEDIIAQKYVEELKVRTPSINTIVKTLSGGNQQKVVIGKWIANTPRVFIMDTPTVGIDIGSKAEIYEQIHKFADEGMAIILISDEVPEILANCNRVMIMSGGRCVKILEEELKHSGAEKMIAELISEEVLT